MRRSVVSSVTAFALIMSSSLPAFSATATTGAPIKLNPTVLRTELIKNNLSVLQALNQVQQAKIKINLARAELLPSLNLGLTAGSGHSGFFMSAVSIFLPFLVPNNWFEYNQSKYMFEAEKDAFYLMELNLYASVRSTYATVVGDMGLRRVLKTQYDNLNRVVGVIQAKYDFGLASESELLNAKAQAKLARVQLSQMDALLANEKATLRVAMAIPLGQTFDVQEAHVPQPPNEGHDVVTVAREALRASPEYAQINYLIMAADQNNWQRVFAFFNSGALSSSGSAANPASFSKLAATASFSIGFAMVPAYQLSNAAFRQLALRQTEIEFEISKVVEQALSGLNEANLQLSQASQAEASLKKVFEYQLDNYNLGFTDLLHVLDAQRSVTQASMAKINALMELDNLRISLHRSLMTDDFEKIPRCQAPAPEAPKRGVVEGIKEFFSSAAIQKSVDDMCRGPQ
jgi:outer membrane protein TolC